MLVLLCAFASENSSMLSIQHHHSHGPGKSPKSGKLSLLVKPSRDHLTAPRRTENFSLDLTSVCRTQIVHELCYIWRLWARGHTLSQEILLKADDIIYITPH